MTKTGIALGLVLALLGGGCVGQKAPQKSRYVLDIRPPQVRDPGAAGVVQIGRIRVAPLFERKGLVYRTSDDRYESEFYHEYYSPPGPMVRRSLVEWFERSGVFSRVVSATVRIPADWWLEGRIAQLHADVRDPNRAVAVAEVEFILIDANSVDLDVAFDRTYTAVVALADREPESVVTGIRDALVRIFLRLDDDLLDALAARAAAQARPEPVVEEEDVRP